MILPAGWQLFDHATLGSTNDEAKRLAREGAPEGTIVRARSQSAGRGRHGNSWTSLDGNLFCTFIFRPKENASQLSFVAAVALAQAAGQGASLKWPNDLLIGGKKAAGILLEAESDWIVIGIGVNLSDSPDGAARVEGFTADTLLEKLSANLHHWHGVWQAQGFAPIRVAWLERAQGLNQPARARLARETIMGVFESLDETGALVLRLPHGERRLISSGEVFAA